MNRVCVLTALISLLLAGQAPAQEEQSPDRDTAARMEEWAERVSDRLRGWVDQRLRERPANPGRALQRNLRLTFEIAPREKADDTFSVVTARSQFRSMVAMQQGEGGFRFAVEGDLEPLEDGRLLLTCTTSLHFAGGESEAEVELAGSSLVAIGQTVELATVGERRLTVRIDEVPVPARP